MNKKKAIAVSVVLLLVLLIGGMLAFFTDTDTATNVFTLGDGVDISITETWNASDGEGIHPGAVVNKAPKIKNDSTTTPAYVFAEIEIPCYASTGTTVNTPLFNYTVNSGWTLIYTSNINTTTKTIKKVYVYGTYDNAQALAPNTTTTNAVFNSVTLEPLLTKEQADTASTTPNIVINAYGIQTDNLGTIENSLQIFNLFGTI